MPSSREHRTKFESNRIFLDQLRSQTNPNLEWVATVAFYSAVHLVEALAAEAEGGPIHHENHVVRELFVAQYHRPIRQHLAALKTASETARYRSVYHFQMMFRPATVAALVEVHLAEIERYVFATLNWT